MVGAIPKKRATAKTGGLVKIGSLSKRAKAGFEQMRKEEMKAKRRLRDAARKAAKVMPRGVNESAQVASNQVQGNSLGFADTAHLQAKRLTAIAIGDVVYLKSGSRAMTVAPAPEKINDVSFPADHTMTITWNPAACVAQYGSYPTACLTKTMRTYHD